MTNNPQKKKKKQNPWRIHFIHVNFIYRFLMGKVVQEQKRQFLTSSQENEKDFTSVYLNSESCWVNRVTISRPIVNLEHLKLQAPKVNVSLLSCSYSLWGYLALVREPSNLYSILLSFKKNVSLHFFLLALP